MGADIDTEERFADEIARLPGAFNLREYPGEYFRAVPTGSHVSGNGDVTLQLQVFTKEARGEPTWKDHSRLTVRDIVRQLVEHDGDRKFGNEAKVDAHLMGEQPERHLLEKLEEEPLSRSRLINGERVFGYMDGDKFVPEAAEAGVGANANTDRIHAAISSICALVLQRHAHDRSAQQSRVSLLRAMADQVRTSYAEELKALNVRIEACLLPVEPLRLAWNVFRLFDVEHEEIRWTQWFAAILRPETGERCSRVAWRAFCEAVARRAASITPSGDSALADQEHWRVVAHQVPTVEDEVRAGELGTLDLLVTTSSIVAAIENKLRAGWHDGTKAPQADRYREIAQSRLAGCPERRLGLVLLSQRHGLKPGDYPSDYVHVSWRDVGWALRDALRREWSDDQQTAIELWPIVLTLVSIEQDLLGLSVTPSPTASRSLTLKGLSELATYLEGR